MRLSLLLRRTAAPALLAAAALAAWTPRLAAAQARPTLSRTPQQLRQPQNPQNPQNPPLGQVPDRPPAERRGIQAEAAEAAAPEAGELAAEQMSVRELMHLETRAALEQARGRARNHRYPDSAPAGAGPGREGLKLVAIYGVGKKLLAEVLVGSHPHVYLRGQALPLGAKAGAQVYRLHGITGSCVHLERRGEAHTLCLHPSQWAGG